jgi:altronate hydrolase
MNQPFLKIHPYDNIVVALRNLKKGEIITVDDFPIEIHEDIEIKHKFALNFFHPGDYMNLYGVRVGTATLAIPRGGKITTENTEHSTSPIQKWDAPPQWTPPEVTSFKDRTFMGYQRADGKVGTMNYWLVIPLVFCENRNLKIIQQAMLSQLGYKSARDYSVQTEILVEAHKSGKTKEEILSLDIDSEIDLSPEKRVFENIDGIKFLYHEGGCGGTRGDSDTLCRLLASYVAHPNVGGATILSLGCQHAQYKIFEEALNNYSPEFNKPLVVLEQQKIASERELISQAVKKTFVGMIEANEIVRTAAPISKISIGLECGASDGFSGITANPALGYTSDLMVGLGGQAVLSEFPELNGVEQELINRCNSAEDAEKFEQIMENYNARAKAVGSGFDKNPSPGNIKDGLITDAMKSAGAAKKGGTSPVQSVLDYTEIAEGPGLHLLCTPGNDVESTTGLASAGCNIIVFTTGLGTPTGNPITPVIKFATNDHMASKMSDIIDINAGSIVSGPDTIESKGEELLEFVIEVASGRVTTKAVQLAQDDFIPWKRGISL